MENILLTKLIYWWGVPWHPALAHQRGGGGVLEEVTAQNMWVLSAGPTTAVSAILKIFEELFRLFLLQVPWEPICLFCYVIFYSRIALPLPKIGKTNTLNDCFDLRSQRTLFRRRMLPCIAGKAVDIIITDYIRVCRKSLFIFVPRVDLIL